MCALLFIFFLLSERSMHRSVERTTDTYSVVDEASVRNVVPVTCFE